MLLGRRLHGRRGLKSVHAVFVDKDQGRRLHGRRGLKFGSLLSNKLFSSRRLHGRRGLKFDGLTFAELSDEVADFTGGVD